jgi:hypothetical protein
LRSGRAAIGYLALYWQPDPFFQVGTSSTIQKKSAYCLSVFKTKIKLAASSKSISYNAYGIKMLSNWLK